MTCECRLGGTNLVHTHGHCSKRPVILVSIPVLSGRQRNLCYTCYRRYADSFAFGRHGVRIVKRFDVRHKPFGEYEL